MNNGSFSQLASGTAFYILHQIAVRKVICHLNESIFLLILYNIQS